MMFITSSIAFGEGGGSVEELCTPFMMLTMYLTLKDVIDKNPLETRTSLIIGIFSAYTFFMKYTLCGFYFGLIVGIVLYYSIQKFNKQEYTKFVSAFFKGIFIVVILVLIYLVAVGNLYDMLIQYFYNNIFKYSDFNSNVLIDIFFAPVQSILDNPKYGMLIVLGFMYLLITLKNNSNILVITLTTLFFLCVGIYCGGVYYEYYGLPLCVFAFLGAIVIYEIVANAGLSNRNINILCLIILLLSSTLIINEKKPLLNRNISKDSSQYVFAEIINEEENPTLLNYNCLDAGFYFTTGIIPTCKYYYKPNHMSFIKEEQTNAINNREFTFFVSDRVVDNSNYELVKHVDYYYLYKLIEDNK